MYQELGLTDPDDRWIASQGTRAYDVNKIGQWQHLETTIETSLDTQGGHLAIERATKETETDVKLWIDDIKLELLEAP